MAIKLVREFQQKQQFSFTPLMKKSIDLLQLSRLEIINKINSEIEDNPFILKESFNNADMGYDDVSFIENFSAPQTLHGFLDSQLQDLSLNSFQKKIGNTIINSLEENGLLSIDIDAIQGLMDHQFSSQEIQTVLENIIHKLDPAGIGGRNFKEIIFLQLERKNLNITELYLSKEILFNPKYTNFKEAKLDLIEKHSEVTVSKILNLIKNCDLSPGLDFQPINFAHPDLEIISSENDLEVQFITGNFPKLILDQDLEKLTKDKKNNASTELKEKIGHAKWLIKAVGKRNETVQRVGTLICQKQSDFLLDVSPELKPLSNLELAKELKLSPSTVSRILRSKYIQTSKGTVTMKSLLTSSVSRTKKVTPIKLMEEIQRIIMTEPPKLSDQKISNLLNQRGFNLARRTIAKYRTKINIPNSRNR